MAAGSARPVEIVGYEGELPLLFPDAREREQGVYVSDRLARRYGLEPGRYVEIASTRSTLTPLGPMPRVRRMKVRETFAHSLLDHQEQLAMPLAAALTLLGRSSDHLVVETGDLSRAIEVGPALARDLPAGAEVRTWQDLNAPLLLA